MGVLAPNKPHKKRKKIVPFLLLINNSPFILFVCVFWGVSHMGKTLGRDAKGGGGSSWFYMLPPYSHGMIFFLFQRRWAKVKEKRRPYKTTKTWKKEREKKWNKEKRESVSCMWRVPILVGTPLGPTTGPLPQENPTSTRTSQDQPLTHKGVLDLTHWLMYQTNNKVGSCTRLRPLRRTLRARVCNLHWNLGENN
jgi:hypothetical protein